MLLERTKRRGSEGFLARTLIERLDRGETLPTKVPYCVQTWCFGDDMAMVFLAGEVVVDYALRLKWEIDAERLWIVAYSNDVPSYIPSRRILSEGGYEADSSMIYYGHPSRYAPEIEDRIIQSVHEILPAAVRRAEGEKVVASPTSAAYFMISPCFPGAGSFFSHYVTVSDRQRQVLIGCMISWGH